MAAGRTHVGDIWGRETDISHNSDYDMFLHVKFPGVKAPGVPKGGKLVGREDLLQKFTGWEGTSYDHPSAVVRTELGWAKRTATGQRWHQR